MFARPQFNRREADFAKRAPEPITRTGIVKSSLGGDASRAQCRQYQVKVIGEEIGKDDDAKLTHHDLPDFVAVRFCLSSRRKAQQSAARHSGASHLLQVGVS